MPNQCGTVVAQGTTTGGVVAVDCGCNDATPPEPPPAPPDPSFAGMRGVVMTSRSRPSTETARFVYASAREARISAPNGPPVRTPGNPVSTVANKNPYDS